jgi:outer membrane protein
MKYLVLLSLILSTLFSQEAQKKGEITIGLGIYGQTQPYKDVSTILLPSPVIFFDNGLFYMRWSRGGIYFYGEKSDALSWGFSFTAQPRTFGYKASDSLYLQGMDERKQTFEGGLAFSAQKEDLYIEIMALTDILDRYESWLVKTEIGNKYTLGDFSFYPSIIVSYQSADFINYYYGVSESEEDLSIGRYAYEASGGFQLGAQTYIKYPITKNLSTLVNLRIDRVADSAQDSPIVADNYIYSGLASLIYRFEY